MHLLFTLHPAGGVIDTNSKVSAEASPAKTVMIVRRKRIERRRFFIIVRTHRGLG
jgi:hypothetical protein